MRLQTGRGMVSADTISVGMRSCRHPASVTQPAAGSPENNCIVSLDDVQQALETLPNDVAGVSLVSIAIAIAYRS